MLECFVGFGFVGGGLICDGFVGGLRLGSGGGLRVGVWVGCYCGFGSSPEIPVLGVVI